MKIEIFQTKELVTERIAHDLGPILSLREVEMFDHAQNSGPVYVAYVDSSLVACWGIIAPSFMSDKAYIWFWGPPVRFPIAVLRYSRRVIQEALCHYDLLYGYCSLGSSSFRWMQWLGAEFYPPVAELVPFEIRGRSDG